MPFWRGHEGSPVVIRYSRSGAAFFVARQRLPRARRTTGGLQPEYRWRHTCTPTGPHIMLLIAINDVRFPAPQEGTVGGRRVAPPRHPATVVDREGSALYAAEGSEVHR